jgi:hypothetical protein
MSMLQHGDAEHVGDVPFHRHAAVTEIDVDRLAAAEMTPAH